MGRRREFNEDQVVEQAVELFWRRGFRATTPQALTEATGLSRSSLYATFDSKQGLFLRALEQYIDAQVEMIDSLTAEGRLRHGLERMYDQLIRFASTERTCLVCSSTVEAPLDEPAVGELVRRGHRRVEDVLYRRLVRAQQEGDLDPARSPRSLARFLLSNNMGLMLLGRAEPDAKALHALAAEVVRAVC